MSPQEIIEKTLHDELLQNVMRAYRAMKRDRKGKKEQSSFTRQAENGKELIRRIGEVAESVSLTPSFELCEVISNAAQNAINNTNNSNTYLTTSFYALISIYLGVLPFAFNETDCGLIFVGYIALLVFVLFINLSYSLLKSQLLIKPLKTIISWLRAVEIETWVNI